MSQQWVGWGLCGQHREKDVGMLSSGLGAWGAVARDGL